MRFILLRCKSDLSDDGEGGAHGGFGTEDHWSERYCYPARVVETTALLVNPATLGANKQRDGVAGRDVDGLHKGRSAGGFVEQHAVLRGIGDGGVEFRGVGNFGNAKTAGLFAGLARDSAPALDALESAVEEPLFTAVALDRDDFRDAELRRLFDGPFEALEFDKGEVECDGGKFRRGLDFIEDGEGNQILSRRFDLGQPDSGVIGDFEFLAGFDAEDAREVVRVVACQFRAPVTDPINEKTSPRHVQSLRHPMIALLRGTLVEKHPNQAILDVGGVGYDVTIPISTFAKLPAAGAETRLRIHTHVREDALMLYGFLSQDEKNLFEKLIGVSNIGPGLAIKVLSGMEAGDLLTAIRRSEIEKLVRIPGVGKKTAERIVLELRDKLPAPAGGTQEAQPALSSLDEDVLSALTNLGCARPQAEAAVRKARANGAPAEFEPLFRKALELAR